MSDVKSYQLDKITELFVRTKISLLYTKEYTSYKLASEETIVAIDKAQHAIKKEILEKKHQKIKNTIKK